MSLVGAALVVYDLLGPHSGWTVIGMLMIFAGAMILRRA